MDTIEFQHSTEPIEYNAQNWSDPLGLLATNWSWFMILQGLIFSLIILCTIIGNLLVILTVLLNRKVRSPTQLFIANLALADFLVGFLVLPFNALTQVTRRWYFGPDYCIAWTCIHLWLCSASILSICAICLDRYIGVTRPLKHFKLMQNPQVKAIIGMVWFLAFCLGVIPVFVWPEPPSEDFYVCKINQQIGLVMVVSVGIFYIPLALMLLLYGRIFVVAKRHIRSIRQGALIAKSAAADRLRIHCGGGTLGKEIQFIPPKKYPVSSSMSDSTSDGILQTNSMRQTKAAKRLTVVVGAFIICYFPFFTVFLIKCLCTTAVPDSIFEALGWLRYFNCALNPIIYAAMLPVFRNTFYQILCCRPFSN